MKRSHRAPLLALISLAISSGCGGDDENPIVPQPPTRSSIEALLTGFFDVAYQGKNSAMYGEMLHPDFEFEFLAADAADLQDRGILPPGKNAWDRGADLASASAMFASADVGDIALNISIDSTAPDTTCAGCQRVLTTVILRVTTRPNDPDPLILSVDSKQEFLVGRDPADSTKWIIVRQCDSDLPAKVGGPGARTGRFDKDAATEPTTWGSIKGIYTIAGKSF